MRRHFTVTGFVVEGGATLLHWHRKIGIWLPPGGHIEADEDPVQAVLREVREETGIMGEIVRERPAYAFENVAQLPSPLSIIVADVEHDEDTHQHIDFSYVVRPVDGAEREAPEHDHGFIWVTQQQLRDDVALPIAEYGAAAAVPDDVREVGLRAIELARSQP
jgi:ADP-ribose pyrophosphatase YjhB (NUDIX family)